MIKIIPKRIRELFSQKNASGILLIGSVDSLITLHKLCIYGGLVSSAKKLIPAFQIEKYRKNWLRSILEQYFDEFQIFEKKDLSYGGKVRLFFISIFIWISLFRRRNLISLKWDNRIIGDIVYDQYLASYCKGTVYYHDFRLALNIYRVISALERAREDLKIIRPDAVLLAHKVGLTSATLAEACEENKISIYSIGGGFYGTLLLSGRRKDYEYSPTPAELEQIMNLPDDKFIELFEAIQGELYLGKFNADSKLAFANQLFSNRQEFAAAYGLDVNKKNIFIMLHAFTDYPHSHFNGMLFNDYTDWFIQTLNFALLDKSVNWIIKSHPSSDFYPIQDLDLEVIKKEYRSDNLIFLLHNENFDSRSINYIGDVVVTCAGTAGFEFSALGGIPSVTAGDNAYANAGFAIYPSSRADYFNVLQNISKLGPITGGKLKYARATFMFIHRLSRVPMHTIIDLSHSDYHKLQHDDEYFSMVSSTINRNELLIVAELDKYIQEISKSDFRALRTNPNEYWSN